MSITRSTSFLAGLGLCALLAGAARAATLPVLPASLDPARVTTATLLAEGATRLDVQWLGTTATRLSWTPGGLWRLDQRDGSARFLLEGAVGEAESGGQPLLPRAGSWLEVPAAGAVRLVVEAVELRPLEGARPALGRPKEALLEAPDGDRALLDPADPAASALAAAAGFDRPALLGRPVIFRDLRMVALNLHPVILAQGTLQRVVSLTLRLDYGGAAEGAPGVAQVSGNDKPSPPRPWSNNLERVYRGLVPNHGQFYDLVDESVFPVYLITGSPNYLGAVNPGVDAFVKWKREKGFDVRVVPFDQIPGGGVSISFGDLRAWVAQQWQELRPEYLLLVGDVDGVAACPDSCVQAHTGDYDVSDHFYAMQEGEDFFPEIFVGRFSVDNSQQLYVMGEKPVFWEKDPLVAGDGWLTKALVVSCNYSDAGTPPISPNQTSRWLIDKLRANGFTIGAGDSLFYPPVTDGGSVINAALNQGRGIVNYRGWANSNGWIYPAYDRTDLDALTNVMRMFFLGSFVCQTGAFGQCSGDVIVEDPCFGEKATRLGSPGAPRGAVAFVGPSDLHTRTQYNNPVCSGFYTGLFDLGLTSIGPALLNGKMELYTGYPLERDDPFSSYFYFHIYNVLGDPDLKLWRHEPTRLALDAPTALNPGQDLLEVVVNNAAGEPVDGATVTLTGGVDGSLLLARGVALNGHVLLDLDPALLPVGTAAVLTADHVDYMPAQRNLLVADAAQALELTGLQVTEETADGQYRADETLQVRLVLRNSGSAAIAAGNAELRDPALWEELPDHFTIQAGTVATPALAAGETGTTAEALQLRLDGHAPNQALLHLVTDLTAGSFAGVADGRLAVASLELGLVSAQWRSAAAQLVTGQLDTLDLVLENIGAYDLAGASLSLESADPRVGVVDSLASLPALPLGGQAAVSFVLQGEAGLFTGQVLQVSLTASETGRHAVLEVPLPVGPMAAEDPMGPDGHGYYAIESGDYDVRIRPAFDYVELDPAYGGSSTRLLLADDDVATIDLPFPVTHYGRTGSRLSICSNGWISLGDTWIDDFRNMNLPSSLGPPNLIAGYWDDLKPHYPDSSYVPVYWRHDAAEGRVVVAWSRAYNRYAWENPGQPLQEFEIILYDQATRPTPTGDTEILVQWKQVVDMDQNNNFATCGMENFGHDVGIQVSYASHPSPGCLGFGAGRSALFTTRQPLHDSSYRVRVTEPLPEQWLTTTTPVIRWDHAGFAQVLQREDITYTVAVLSGSAPLFSRQVTAAGQLDLAAAGLALPENQALTLNLSARADTTDYPALQGSIAFFVDATAPALTPALLASELYPGHLELGLLASEALASLSARVMDGLGEVMAVLEQDEGPVQLGSGQELRYLRAQLQEGFSVLRIEARDLHGLDAEEELPLAAVPFTAGGALLPDAGGLVLSWAGADAGWALLLGRRDAGDTRLLELGEDLRRVELRLPAGARDVSVSLAAPAGDVLVQWDGAAWQRLPQARRDGRLSARLEGSGALGLMEAGQAPAELPQAFRLLGNHPNPFNPETWIAFELPREGQARLTLYNLAGAQVRALDAGRLGAGRHQLRWDGRGGNGAPVASGVYLARLEWEGQIRVQRMLLVR